MKKILLLLLVSCVFILASNVNVRWRWSKTPGHRFSKSEIMRLYNDKMCTGMKFSDEDGCIKRMLRNKHIIQDNISQNIYWWDWKRNEPNSGWTGRGDYVPEFDNRFDYIDVIFKCNDSIVLLQNIRPKDKNKPWGKRVIKLSGNQTCGH